jgi:pheromone shutdown-related protein TraB
LHFIDRNIQTTFSRIWNRLTLREKINLLTELVFSTFSNEQITEAQLEAMKESDMIEQALAQIQGKYTTIKTVLIDERDQYMAAKIKTAPGDVIVAIIGAAHAQGIKDYLHQSVNLQELDTVPPKKVTAKIAGWIIPITIVALIIATFSIDVSLGWQQIKTWVLLNGSFAAVGTALVLAHPLTILVAFVVAPISSLSPLLAVGWFTGLVEAFLNKPTVQDLQNVAKDFKSLKTIFKNKFIKILLVVIMANLFSSIATFLSSFQIIRNLLNFK